ncbi:hypothetical protein KP509_16G075500 [Ceratopteris richardii]|uniref:Uncharacterized protein n=1 Tax=Ceratopteris richardii TaxID=49495 RepID=A0A8T2T0U4_CERRI|nr:hypothetical protein KP509_16G075500 [Ceratopteris richardii]
MKKGEYKAHQKVDLETLMPKLHKLRRVQHRVAPHFFEDRVKLKLKTQAKVLLDLEKAINEWTFGREITTINGLISIAVNVKRDKIEQKKKKTLEEIHSVLGFSFNEIDDRSVDIVDKRNVINVNHL